MGTTTITITEGDPAAERPHRVEVAADDLTGAHWPSDFDSLEASLGPALAVGAGSRRFHIGHVETRQKLALEVKVWDDREVVLAAARCAVCLLRCVLHHEVRVNGWLAQEALDCSSEPEHEGAPDGYDDGEPEAERV